ncbi:MAG: cupin domain-containing protein [Casimicrobiaceae bacterium]
MSDKAADLARLLIRNFGEAPTERFVREPLYESACARLADGTAAQNLGASIDTVAPGKRSCPYHFHHGEEEMFIIIAGSGTLRVAGEMLPLRAGDIAFIPPGPRYPHQIINTSLSPLTYLSISTRQRPEVVEYPDSAKILSLATRADGEPMRSMQRVAASVDYWDGEP